MSNKNGNNLAGRVKAALMPKPPRITLIALTVVYDVKTGTAGVTFASPQSGALDIADLYRAVEAARRHVMQMEQQSILQQAQDLQAAGLRQASTVRQAHGSAQLGQSAQPDAAGQVAEPMPDAPAETTT